MIILDVLATGTDPEKNSILSIAAVDFNDSEERFYEECQPWSGAEVDPETLERNLLSEDEVLDVSKKKESDIVQNILYWIKQREGREFAGRDVVKQVEFINAGLRRAGVDESLSMNIYNEFDLNSIEVQKGVGLYPEPLPRVGINGALWSFETLYRLQNHAPKLEEFSNYPVL